MKNFNYYKPRPLVAVIIGIYVLIISLKDFLFEDLLSNHPYLNPVINIGTATGIILLFFLLYNRWLWKIRGFNNLVNFPNIKGSYYGKLISVYKDENGNPVEKECLLDIYQTASEIHFMLYFATNEEKTASSVSKSLSHALTISEEQGTEIVYTYENTPLKERDKYGELNKHSGTSTLHWNKSNSDEVRIAYYNNERKSGGNIFLKKLNEENKGKFYRPEKK
ncbi:MAG: hypothetical protein K8R54_04885 [Bacteroidales bacterium]|nr:hypothetical protein [Bacteroidales bacterium]